MGKKKPGVVYKRKYRKAEDRIQPITTQLPEEFRIIRNIIGDPLENMPVLLTHPPDFVPGLRYTQEWYEKLQLNPDGFLWPEEEKLVHHLVKEKEECLSWIEEEKGEISSLQSASRRFRICHGSTKISPSHQVSTMTSSKYS
jgi:hypothetical protein